MALGTEAKGLGPRGTAGTFLVITPTISMVQKENQTIVYLVQLEPATLTSKLSLGFGGRVSYPSHMGAPGAEAL